MDAIRVSEYGGPEVLEAVDVPVPDPDPDEVRIDVRAVGVNFADVEKRRGNYPDGPEPPYRPGLEVAGVVAESGSDADPAIGDRVAALVSGGGYAETAVAPTDAVVPVPDALSFPEAAALPVQYLTAHNALFGWGGLENCDGEGDESERVLVTAAAGGVGTAAVQLAARAGVTVVGVASTDEKRALVRELGADHAVGYDDLPDAVAERVDGVDLALEGVGGRVFTDVIEALSPGGRVVTYGMASGRVPTVATPRLFFENKSVIGYHLEEARSRTPERVFSAVPSLLAALEAGDVEIVVDETIPLADAGLAHDRLEGRESTGKVVLVP